MLKIWSVQWKSLDDQNPLFICVSDIPCITVKVIRRIADAYDSSGKDACSSWVPADLVQSYGGTISYREKVNGIDACPAGVNILRGDLIAQPQDELQVLLSEPGLALNVNTQADLARAEEFIKRQPLL